MTDKKEIAKVLSKIQKELKVPKGQMNSFGGYKYRSCEDIVEAVKQILPDGVYLHLSDDIVNIGDRYYVRATAKLCAEEDYVSAIAYAREPLEKKGMDASQITGATSSYARKYALNGLFGIDDTKDADTQDNTPKSAPATSYTPRPATKPVKMGYEAALEEITKANDSDKLMELGDRIVASKKLTGEEKDKLRTVLNTRLDSLMDINQEVR